MSSTVKFYISASWFFVLMAIALYAVAVYEHWNDTVTIANLVRWFWPAALSNFLAAFSIAQLKRIDE